MVGQLEALKLVGEYIDTCVGLEVTAWICDDKIVNAADLFSICCPFV